MLDNLKVKDAEVKNANQSSAELQFAGEWGDTPGGPEDGQALPESPR